MTNPKEQVLWTKLAEKAVFPIFGKTLAQCDPETGAVTVLGGTGMTLLEYASIEAMKGFCANPDPGLVVVSVERRAELSVKQARALMTELEKQSCNN